MTTSDSTAPGWRKLPHRPLVGADRTAAESLVPGIAGEAIAAKAGDPTRGQTPRSVRSFLEPARWSTRRASPLRVPREKHLALFGLCAFLLGLPGCEREPSFEVPTARLDNEAYSFSVAYPDTMDTRTYTPERMSIGFAAGEGFDARTELAIDADSTMAYEALVEQSARNSCYADGPGMSQQCTVTEPHGTVRSESGDEGTIFYLTVEVTEVPGGRLVSTMLRGPYVAFDLTSREGPPTVLWVRAPITRQLAEADVELVLNVARSLRLED